MKSSMTEQGFVVVKHRGVIVIQESAAMACNEHGNLPADAVDNPGSSYLWVGEHHFDREEIAELAARMNYWLAHKRLANDEGK